MRTVGLIVEYNPFHNGHQYHLRQSLSAAAADAVVAVMSGNFLQRGEPALFDKWTRAEMALRGGCDLVIELPVAYSTQPAEWFAYGAVALLEQCGVVDALCFGSESGDIGSLREIAAVMAHEPEPFRALLQEQLRTGASYPAAYSSAVRALLSARGMDTLAAVPLDQPNNSLGLHYLLALERLGSKIAPLTIKREKAGYNDQAISDASIASATAIRKLMLSGSSLDALAPYIPETTHAIIAREQSLGRTGLSWENFAPQLFHMLATHSPAELGQYREISEGLEHRLLHSLPGLEHPSVEALLAALKTKRYTRTKLQRALLSILLRHHKGQFSRDQLRSGIAYIRVLGFTGKGQQLLKRMKQAARLPVALSPANLPISQFPYLQLDLRAAAAYALAAGEPAASGKELHRDFYTPPIRL